MQFARALVLFAHPDDAEFGFGGTVARWAREGTEVHYACATDGSAGSNTPGEDREFMRPIRAREMEAAAERARASPRSRSWGSSTASSCATSTSAAR